MPGYLVSGSIFLDLGAQSQWEKYICPKCDLLLREAVQPSCGHLLCQSCAEELFRADLKRGPRCPRKECGEELVGEDGLNFFPDRFVRREIQTYDVQCLNHLEGCSWQGKFSEYEEHVSKDCRFAKHPCKHCGVLLSGSELAIHEATCPKPGQQCPLVGLGCLDKSSKLSAEMKEHLGSPEGVVTHLTYIATAVKELRELGLSSEELQKQIVALQTMVTKLKKQLKDWVFRLSLTENNSFGRSQAGIDVKSWRGDADSSPIADMGGLSLGVMPQDEEAPTTKSVLVPMPMLTQVKSTSMPLLGCVGCEELQKQEKEIVALQMAVTKLKKQLRAKNTELNGRDFQLSFIKSRSFDGTIIWKIPQLEQRMVDVRGGKYTSISSPSFYTGRYGYKMCLRLYILGDGTGKNTHMSLFFVIMRGECDSELQWPFAHRVTMHLINQKGGRDISETFQPDPTSSAFKKPKSHMNIASGCPKFVSHQELNNVEDAIFIKCTVDLSTRMDVQPFQK